MDAIAFSDVIIKDVDKRCILIVIGTRCRVVIVATSRKRHKNSGHD
jgi:hypothetical protein